MILFLLYLLSFCLLSNILIYCFEISHEIWFHYHFFLIHLFKYFCFCIWFDLKVFFFIFYLVLFCFLLSGFILLFNLFIIFEFFLISFCFYFFSLFYFLLLFFFIFAFLMINLFLHFNQVYMTVLCHQRDFSRVEKVFASSHVV